MQLQKKATGIIAAIFIILIAAVLGVLITSLFGTESKSSLNYMYSQQVLMIADGGLQYYTELLENQSSAWTTPPPKPSGAALGKGTFTITTANEAQDEIDVVCNAVITGPDGNSVTRVVTAHVQRGPHEAFNYFGYVENHIQCNGTTGEVDGSLNAGNSVQNYDEEDMTVTGDIEEGTGITIPIVDFDYYAGIAVDISTKDFTAAGGPYNGIYFYDGNVTIGDNVVINGGVIATGKIDMQKSDNINITALDQYPILVAGSTINGVQMTDSNFLGIVYAEGTIDLANSSGCRFDGVIISGNNLVLNNSDNDIGEQVIYNPPGFSGGGGVAVTEWEENY